MKEFELSLDVPDGTEFKMRDLLAYIRDNLIKERPELFLSEDTVCVWRARSRRH